MNLFPICQAHTSASIQTVVEDDEAIMDLALDAGVLKHLPEFILSAESFKSEEFYVRRIHQLLTDFIVLMPLKVRACSKQ